MICVLSQLCKTSKEQIREQFRKDNLLKIRKFHNGCSTFKHRSVSYISNAAAHAPLTMRTCGSWDTCFCVFSLPSQKRTPSLFYSVTTIRADHSGRAVWGMNCLRSLERRDRRFESQPRHRCLCAFILCFCSVCKQRPCYALIPPVPGVLPIVYRIKKLKKRPRSNKMR
jgi:hypothetical protein